VAKSKKTNLSTAVPPKAQHKKTGLAGSVVAAGVLLAFALWAGVQFMKSREIDSETSSTSASYAWAKPLRRGEGPTLSTEKGAAAGHALSAQSTVEKHSEQVAAASTGQNSTNPNTASGALATLEVAQAVMVTVELDFGATVPSIANALREIERRSKPDDGVGRTFAILDAYGEPTPTGKLHMSMHVSTEKPGTGSLILKRTGETLWTSRIVPSKEPKKGQFTGKNLSIFVDDGAGHLLTIDGSNNPTWIMDAVVKERAALLDSVWPTGVEHEVTFIYSACGCPVKVLAKREGDRVVRTKELPVMFPDDPAVVEIIGRLMRW
jgi:hypothetical protein